MDKLTGLPGDMTLDEARKAQADQAAAEQRQRRYDAEVEAARQYEADVAFAARFGLTYAQYQEISDYVIDRYETD